MGSIENLINAINTVIADGQTTVEEKRDVDNKFTLFNSALATFNTKLLRKLIKAIQDKLKGIFRRGTETSDAKALEDAADAAKACTRKLPIQLKDCIIM